MTLLVGVDVQGSELIVAFRRDGAFLTPAKVVSSAAEVVDHILQQRRDPQEQVVVSIDAPRRYLDTRRRWSLNPAGNWIPADCPCGRHCEIIVRRLGFANPQWTPPATHPIPWISLGQQLFTAIEAKGLMAIECFPTASYTRLGQMKDVILNIPGEMFAHSRLAHDVLDACVAALTADLFVAGNATELGGDDGCGTIVVPGVLQASLPPFPNP